MAAILPALQTPKCSLCKTTFNNMEYMNTHMKTVHGESDHERIDRLFKTVTSVRTREPIKEVTFIEDKEVTFIEDKNTHYVRYHINSYDSEENTSDNICDLCDKVLPNKTQKSNHMLFQHTISNSRLKCDYCEYWCSELMELCKHISTEHEEMFPKKDAMENKCDMCYTQFSSKEKFLIHMKEMHSPESFYEKIVEDISGECRV